MNRHIITAILLSIIASNAVVLGFSRCTCTPNTTAFPGANTSTPTTNSISNENEFVNSVDQGKLINFGENTVLQKLSPVARPSSKSLAHSCPNGFIPFTKEELEVIAKRTDLDQLFGATYLNLDQKWIIYSSTKVNPTITNGSDNLAYDYYTMTFDASKKPVIGSTSTYWADADIKKTICKRVYPTYTVNLEGYEGYDLEEGKTYEMKVTNSNIEQLYIQDNNGKVYTTKTFSYTHKGNQKWGCATINFRFQLFGGVIAADCLAIWTQPQFAYNADSSITIDQIKKVTLAGVKSNFTNKMFFSPGTAPIAPIVNDSSSVYVYYSDQTTNTLKVQKLSKEGVAIGNAIDTKEPGQPFDIVSTHFGFVVMARNLDQKAWISAYNKDGTLRWSRVLVNNGNWPTTATDQIKFTTNDKCDLPFGMNVMYDPDNGRLNYARGRIQAIWTHYNHFGMKDDGTKDDHTGDTMMSFDADTGYNQKIYWGWGASHSLYQNFNYDGKYLYVASLGDAYPMNIFFRVCDVDLNHKCKESSTVIPGIMPGGGGLSSGRQGGFIDIVGNRGEKYFVYQRKASTIGSGNNVSTNTVNEFAIIRFTRDLKLISTKVLLSDTDALRVNAIKSVRYGKNILIAYNQIPVGGTGNFNYQDVRQEKDESFLMLLNVDDLSTLYGPTKFTTYQVNAADDWRILEDGRIAYTIVDKDNNLNFFYTPSLTTPSYPNPIKSSDAIYGFSTFSNIKITLNRNNFNDVCIKEGDSNYSIVDFQPDTNTDTDTNTGSGNNSSEDDKTKLTVSSSLYLSFSLIASIIIYFL